MSPETALSNIKSSLDRGLVPAHEDQFNFMIELSRLYPNFWFYSGLYRPLAEQAKWDLYLKTYV